MTNAPAPAVIANRLRDGVPLASTVRRPPAAAQESSEANAPWLLRQTVTLPDQVDGFVDRPALNRRCSLLAHSITAIHAPGGFGKTTLLADQCRRLRERGTVVAWLTLDEEFDPRTLGIYLSFAFREAGLKFEHPKPTSDEFDQFDYRISLLMSSIDNHGAPCVLALDDVDRLAADSVSVVNRLVERAPPNLHLAMALRSLPPGLNVATPILQRRGVAITADDLRFDKVEIARLFDRSLGRQALAELTESSRGWPIALRILRNSKDRWVSREVASNWIEMSLWRSLPAQDRDLVLDIGLFDWMDTELVDRALSTGTMRRLQAIPELDGLLHTVGGESGAICLHPLVREYCVGKRLSETPERYRTVHRAIANALRRRGHIMAAMRHAKEAGDSRLAGEVLESAGGLRLWLRQGPSRLRKAGSLLTNETIREFPRLGLVRCMALALGGDLDQAKRQFMALSRRTDGFTKDRRGKDGWDLQFDAAAFQSVIWTCGCQRVGAAKMLQMASSIHAKAEDRGEGPLVRGLATYWVATLLGSFGKLDHARDLMVRARATLVSASPYLTMFADFRGGHIAMVQGRVADAATAYAHAQRTAKSDHLRDAGPSLIAQVLIDELDFETNKIASVARKTQTVPGVLATSGAWLDVYVAAAETAAESMLQERGPDPALEALRDAERFAIETERQTLRRCLVGIRTRLLVAAERIDDAQDLWDRSGLPEGVDDLVDLETQTWREMEVLACADLRLKIARSQFRAARELADRLLAVCADRGLKRTRMRGLALAMVLEFQADRQAAARERLVEYLELFWATDYSRPLIHEREIGLEVLNSLDESKIEPHLRQASGVLGQLLRNATRTPTEDPSPDLSARELEILKRLKRFRDKEIGAALALTEDGVRYHIRKIFTKLGVHSRHEAAHRAQSMGMLP